MKRRPSSSRLSKLLRAADEVRKNAHAPYSKFKVGAAVQAGGRIFAAPNVENSSYPLSICAERNAVGMAVAAGQDRIQAIAVMGPGRKSTAPCGGCRQVIWELSDPDTTVPVVYAADDGPVVTTTIGDLLPSPFGPGNLRSAARARPRRRRSGAV